MRGLLGANAKRGKRNYNRGKSDSLINNPRRVIIKVHFWDVICGSSPRAYRIAPPIRPSAPNIPICNSLLIEGGFNEAEGRAQFKFQLRFGHAGKSGR